MAIKQLKKSAMQQQNNQSIDKFINKGGTLMAEEKSAPLSKKILLQLPNDLLTKIDEKRKEETGHVTRTLWIVKALNKAANK